MTIYMMITQVAPDGTYTKPVNAKAAYGTMTSVRAGIVWDASMLLSRAATIAVRYSAVRRQSELKPGYVCMILDLDLEIENKLVKN